MSSKYFAKILAPAMRKKRGFTLVELLVVVALISGFAVFFIGRLSGGGKSASLESAQATLANMVAAARTRAMASGRSARLLVHMDATSSLTADRYLRYLVLQSHDGSNWLTIGDAYLPLGTYVVPRDPSSINGLLPENGAWTRPSDGSILRSTALRENMASFPDAEVTASINAVVSETWAVIKFTPAGTTANANDLVIAAGEATQGNPAAPIQFTAPEMVQGLSLSSYGMTAFIDDRSSF